MISSGVMAESKEEMKLTLSVFIVGKITNRKLNGDNFYSENGLLMLAQRPSTLVLMMMNSCGYSLLIIL